MGMDMGRGGRSSLLSGFDGLRVTEPRHAFTMHVGGLDGGGFDGASVTVTERVTRPDGTVTQRTYSTTNDGGGSGGVSRRGVGGPAHSSLGGVPPARQSSRGYAERSTGGDAGGYAGRYGEPAQSRRPRDRPAAAPPPPAASGDLDLEAQEAADLAEALRLSREQAVADEEARMRAVVRDSLAPGRGARGAAAAPAQGARRRSGRAM